MGKAKDIELKPITVQIARGLVRRLHYSGKVDTRSQLNIGVYYHGKLEGALQFGPSMAKHQTMHLFKGVGWNEFTELHRMGFSDVLPRNSESRALSISFKLLRQYAPHIKLIISYADATQSGDGAIYRAAGFVLTGITKNNSMWRLTDGNVVCSLVFNPGFSGHVDAGIKGRYGKTGSGAASSFLKSINATPLPGFQLRYMYFLDPAYRTRLTVPELPYSAIDEAGARMYKGKKLTMRPPEGGSLATSKERRFDPDPDALVNNESDK